MFPFSKRKSEPRQPATGNQLVKRGLALGAGILLLWLALEIMPRPRTAQQAVIFPKDTDRTSIPGDAPSTASSPSTPGSSLDLGQITAGLLLVGLIGFALYWQRKKAPGKAPAAALQSMGKIQLNPNQHIHLISCGKEALLIGTTSSQVTLLHQLPLTHLKQETEETAIVKAGAAPQYSTPSTTNLDTADFGILLQHQSLLDPQSETAKSLAATSLEAN